MKRLLLSALVGGCVSLGGAMAAVGSGDAPINGKQWMILGGAFVAAMAKDLQSGLMQAPGQHQEKGQD